MKYQGEIPVSSFDVAPFAPDAVAAAKIVFDRVAQEWHEAQGAALEAAELARIDNARASREAADARVSGTKVPRDPAKVAFKHEQEVASVDAAVVSLTTAMNTAGDQLAVAITENRDEWMAELTATEAAAVDRLKSAFALARQALADVAHARSGPKWLESFKLNDALRGVAGQYVYSPITVDASFGGTDVRFDSYSVPTDMLALIETQVVTPLQPPKPRPLKAARASSMGRR